MKLPCPLFSIVVAALSAAACSSGASNSPGSGGKSGAGTGGQGTGGQGGQAQICSSMTPCGGAVVGTWKVKSSCLSLTGEIDPMDVSANCPRQAITGSLTVSGTWTANANGTFTDDTKTMGSAKFNLDASCLVVSGAAMTCEKIGSSFEGLGFSSVVCTTMAGGSCSCSAQVALTGGLGLLTADPQTSGNYTKNGNVLTITGSATGQNYSYCVSGSTLTITPQLSRPMLAGTLVFDAVGTGTGGNGAANGSGGQGGSAGAGGHAAGSGGSGTGGGSGAAGAGGKAGTGGAGSGGAAGGMTGPCDIYKSAGTPCVTAHSTVRALFAAYSGKLYQVRNAAGATKDINTVAPGGVADAAAQDAFCTGTTCIYTMIYDQSGNGNDLTYEAPDSPIGGFSQMTPVSANKESVKLGGAKVYSVYMQQGNAFWGDGSKGAMPLGSNPQGVYIVTSGTHTGTICCFDYGNASTTRKIEGNGTMDAVNFSRIQTWGSGEGAGPWVMADLEGGLYAQGDQGKNSKDLSQTSPFVTAMEKNNGTTEMTLRAGDASKGSLGTFYKGKLPNGYNPMKKKGGIVLGSGGDCCLTNKNLGEGTFYEGAIVAGYPSDATEDAVQANIVGAQFSK